MRRRSPQVLAAVLTLLAVTLALSACGEDSLSAQQLRAKAAAICTSATRAIDRIPMPAAPAQAGRFLELGLARLRPAAARLRALKAPQDLRGQYDRAVQLAVQEVALVDRHARAIRTGDDPADAFHQLAAALQPLTTEENAFWRALEIPSCVRT